MPSYTGVPTQDIIDRIVGGAVRVTRRAELLDPTGAFLRDLDIVEGSVSVDMGRDERRTLDISLFDDGTLLTGVGPVERPTVHRLWYDTNIRVWRGIEWIGGNWEVPLGTFMIDRFGDEQRIKRRPRPRPDTIGPNPTVGGKDFTNVIKVTGRDRTKLLLSSKFTASTTYKAGTSLADIFIALAGNSEISAGDVILPWSTTNPAPQLAFDITFDADTARWEAFKNLCANYSLECFFNAYNQLVVRNFQDPATKTPVFVFTTGADAGNLVSYARTADDSEIFNQVTVRGATENNAQWSWTAEVTHNASAVNPNKIGVRSWSFASQTITTKLEAKKLAVDFLAVKALESFAVQMGSICFPWLEASEVVAFVDPQAELEFSQPTSFLLTDFEIPLALGPMSSNAKRLVIIS